MPRKLWERTCFLHWRIDLIYFKFHWPKSQPKKDPYVTGCWWSFPHFPESVDTETSCCGKHLIHSGSLANLSIREERTLPSGTIWLDIYPISPQKKTLVTLFMFSIWDEIKANTYQSWKTSNSIDAYLFVHSCTLLLSMLIKQSSFRGVVQFDLFPFIWFCVCLEQCSIWEWKACLDGLGWHFWIVLVPWCLPEWMGAHLYMSLMQ